MIRNGFGVISSVTSHVCGVIRHGSRAINIGIVKEWKTSVNLPCPHMYRAVSSVMSNGFGVLRSVIINGFGAVGSGTSYGSDVLSHNSVKECKISCPHTYPGASWYQLWLLWYT
jgi:hypothetical protein